MNDETRDERLRRLLREADPAANDSGLTLDEVREMRRTALTAIPERRRRLLPVFALAGAATVALILLAVLVLRPAPEKAPAPKVAAVPKRPVTQAIQPPPPKEEPKPSAEKEKKKATVRRKHRAPKVRPIIAEPEPVAILAQVEPAEGPQQIQFSTPGGTRIIWLLSPGKASK
jgi:outer membrane biosynthesis protein TonB